MSKQNERFDEILLELLEQEEKKIDEEFGSLDKEVAAVYKEYRKMDAVFDEVEPGTADYFHRKNIIGRKNMGKSDYASCLGLKISLNLCVAKDLKDAIDARFAYRPNDELCTQLKKYVDQKLEFQGNTREEIAFAQTIKHQFDKHISANGTTSDFLGTSCDVYLSATEYTTRKAYLYDEYMEPEPRKIDDTYSMKDALLEADRTYAKELYNSVIAPFNYRHISGYDPVSFIESYKKQEAFKARDPKDIIAEKRKILKSAVGPLNDEIRASIEASYEGSSLSPQEIMKNKQEDLKSQLLSKKILDEMSDEMVEKNFSKYCYDTLLKDYHEFSDTDKGFSGYMFHTLAEAIEEQIPDSQIAGSKTVEFQNFLIDGKRAESQDEVVVGALSGKKIESDYFEGKTVTILPDIYSMPKTDPALNDNNKNRSFLAKLFAQLWESIKSLFENPNITQKRKIIENEAKMNETLHQSQTRQKMTFAEMADDTFSKKLIAPEKREEIKNKQLEKNTPTKK